MAQTLKFSRTSGTRTRLTIADVPALTLPNGDWTVGCVVVFDGETSGYGGTTQWLISNTEGGSTGSFLLAWYPLDTGSSTTAGRFVLNFNSSVTDRCLSAPVEAGKAYVIVAQRSNGQVTSKLCPVLTTDPTTGATVTTSAGSPLSVALDATTPWNFGDRSTSGRRCDQSIGRFFRIDRALTDLEIAKLAYGYQITDLGTPVFNILGTDPANIVDSGPNAFAITVSGPPTAGTNPGFGYVATVNPPTITGAPSLTGGVTVGVAKSYAAAPMAGTPTPTLSQQWMLDGTDISGATGATYTPVAGDVGKVLSVRQIASNANGSTPATSNGIVVCSVAAGLTITELPAEKFYQQAGGFALVSLGGTYTGDAPTSIQYRLETPDGLLVTQGWTTLSGATISGGAWSAQPYLPTAAKKHRIRGRALNASGNVLFEGSLNVNRFAVGGIGIVVGSSTPAEWFGSGSAANLTPDHDRVSLFDGTNWTLFGEYGCASEMAAYLSQAFGYPFALASAARGGSGLADWLDTTASGTDWARFLSRLSGVGGQIELILGSVGSNDTISLPAVGSRANHLTNLRTFASRMRTQAGNANLPIIWQGINRRTTETTSDLACEYARMAENDFGSDANVYHYQTLQYILSSDGVHMSGSQVRLAAGELVKMGADAIKGTYRRGPKTTGISYTGAGATSAVVALQHRNGTDFTPTSGITGYTAGDADGALTVSASRTDATHITLAFNRGVVPPLWVKYLGGKGPDTTAAVMDNGTQSLPMNVETDLVPVQTSGSAVNLVGSSCTQSNTSSAVSVGVVAGPKTVNLVGAPSSQSNASSAGAVGIVPTGTTIEVSKVPAARIVVFGGGARVVTFDVPFTGPNKGSSMTNAPVPYFKDGKWWVDKDPDEQSFYVANLTKELTDRGTTATFIEPVVKGVEILIAPQIQGNFVVIKLGGLDVTAGAENLWTARVTCANGERFDRTMHFNRVDN